uniref:Uncharacterized protein n=1 Tax=Anguilla anguilla TaxID=7936 RepID=A0A0E9PWV4_ANGAN
MQRRKKSVFSPTEMFLDYMRLCTVMLHCYAFSMPATIHSHSFPKSLTGVYFSLIYILMRNKYYSIKYWELRVIDCGAILDS